MPRLLFLAVVVCSILLCKPLLGASQPLEECPCWELKPDPATGECIEGYLPLVYSSREFSETYAECVDRVTYDADYGALVASLCWNRDCLPERFQGQTVLAELNLGEEELADMTEGNYTFTFQEPSQFGVRTSVLAFKQFKQGVEEVSVQGANFTVPEGNLTRLKIAWEWPSLLNPSAAGSNQAFVIIRNSSLSEVPLDWPGLQSPEDARDMSNLDLCGPIKAVGSDTAGASCGKGKIALRVMLSPEFVGVFGTAVEFEEDEVTALMCVDPPKYDKFTQLLEWGFAWDFGCWAPEAELTEPIVFRMEEVPSLKDASKSGLDGLGMPSNAQIQLMTRSEKIYTTVGGEESTSALVPYFSVRLVNDPFFDGLGGFAPIPISGDNFTFSLPEAGMYSFTLDTKLFPIPDGDSTLGQVRYMGLVSPQSSGEAEKEVVYPGQVRVDMDDSPLKIKDEHTIIDYKATLTVKGQHFYDLQPWTIMLGVRASVQAVGWGITVPVLLRDRSVLSSCDSEDVDAFLVNLANGTVIERIQLNATCVELPPGQAIGYAEQLLNYTTEPAYLRGPPSLQNVTVPNVGGQPTLNRCSDARFGLNITYNYLLPPEDRPEPERLQENSAKESDSSGNSLAAATFSTRANKAKSSHTKGAAKVDPAKMPKVRPLNEEENMRRTLLQDDAILRGPVDILMGLQQAGQNMSALFKDDIGFRDKEFGGSQQYCVHPRGIVSTLVSVKDSILRAKKAAGEDGTSVLPREGRRYVIGNQMKMDTICTSTIEAVVERLEVFLNGGQERPLDIDFLQLTGCYGDTNCIDCWPYEVLEIYQIVLIVCAFCLSVIAILGVRAYMVMKVDSMTKTLRPGYLNDKGTIERLIREQEELDYDDIVD